MTTSFALLGSTTLGSANATISVTGLTARKYLIVEGYVTKTGSLQTYLRFNNDSGSNYSDRVNTNGGVDATDINQAQNYLENSTSSTPCYFRAFIINISSQEKLIICHTVLQNTAGAANSPTRYEIFEKWANTSNQITEVDVISSTSTFATGTLTVWGSD